MTQTVSLLIQQKKFTRILPKKTGIEAYPKDIDEWHYLTNLARASGLLDEEDIQRSEDDYYNPDILLNSQPHLYIRPIIHRTSRIYGRASNFVLTSREPYLENATRKWFKNRMPIMLDKNILIRKDPKTKPAMFKVDEIRKRANKVSWVVLIEDSTKFAEAAREADIGNCVVVCIPQGKISVDFEHERLFAIKRFPLEIQAMYPLLFLINQATST